MPVQPYWELLENRQEKTFTMNQGWNPSNVDVVTENFAYFIRFSKKKIQLIYSARYHQKIQIIIPELQIILLHFILNTTFSKKIFFPSTVIEQNKSDPNLRSAASRSVFKKNLLKFIRLSPSSIFDCHNYKRINYLKRLYLGLSHLREHKFKHSLQDTLNPFCSCSLDGETNKQVKTIFIYCPCLLIKDSPSLEQLKILMVF